MTKHKIDSLFQSKLGNSEFTPSPDAWSRLETQLKKNKKKRFYIKISIAASVLLLVTFGWAIITQQFADNKPDFIADKTLKPTQSKNTTATKKSPFIDSVINKPIEKNRIEKSENAVNINKENFSLKKKTNKRKNLKKDNRKSNISSKNTPNDTIEIIKKNNNHKNEIIDSYQNDNFSNNKNYSENLATSDKVDVKTKESLKIVYTLKPAKSSIATPRPTKIEAVDSIEATEPTTKRAFKKILAFAKNIKNNPTGIASLSEVKKKLIALTKKNKKFSKDK